MGRGKAFDHKKKGHDHQPPKGAFIHKDVNEHTLEEEELPVNIEAYKNSLKNIKSTYIGAFFTVYLQLIVRILHAYCTHLILECKATLILRLYAQVLQEAHGECLQVPFRNE